MTFMPPSPQKEIKPVNDFQNDEKLYKLQIVQPPQ